MKKKELYKPEKEYIVTGKWKMTGDKVEAFLPRLTNAIYKWIEENKGRYEK